MANATYALPFTKRGLVATWITVIGPQGRPRLEMRWHRPVTTVEEALRTAA